jgi:hypothetical protein
MIFILLPAKAAMTLELANRKRPGRQMVPSAAQNRAVLRFNTPAAAPVQSKYPASPIRSEFCRPLPLLPSSSVLKYPRRRL